MAESITYVEIDIPAFEPANSPPELITFRFAIDTAYLPNDIDAIPSIKDVRITPAIISLGESLGQRASVEVIFRDHKHIFAIESFDSGTFWGKFRARYGLTLQGYDLRVIRGNVGDVLDNMETRHFIIESTDGPSTSGEFKIIAKDILKFADGDRAQAPVLSNGFLAADITNVATVMMLSPAGIGDEEYPALNSPDTGFYVNVGGNEIIAVYRVTDTLNVITRGAVNTIASSHSAQDRVQLVLGYFALSPATIINDLLVNYANVDQAKCNFNSWETELSAYLNTVYTALIAEPTSVNKLLSELIEQAGLVMWWDDIQQQVRLQVLRAISTEVDTFDADNMMSDSLEIKEQPEKRLSQVYTYFAKLNPTVKEDQIDNYRSTAFARDETAESVYGVAAIKKVFSRWITDGGRSVADRLNEILLARFVTPPRRISFNILRGSGVAPVLGGGYQIGGWPFQDQTGDAELVPVQVTRLNPMADLFEVEGEEMIFTGVTAPDSPDVHALIIDSDLFNVNLNNMHDSIYAAATSSTTVNCTILEGVTVGSTSTANPALDVGTWPAGVTINLIVEGRIQGKGGAGGFGASAIFASGNPGQAGMSGGTALYTRQAINLTSTNGEIWGGGGGGGGAGAFSDGFSSAIGGNGGDGGAGTNSGTGGALGFGSTGEGAVGLEGTSEAGGDRTSGGFFDGGEGGGPGLAGNAGASGGTFGPGAGGAAGSAIDGDSYVTDVGGVGDIRGSQIN